MDVKGILEELQPDTDNLIVIGIITYLIFATAMSVDISRLSDTAIGGLIGYLGASRNFGTKQPSIPPNIITEEKKTEVKP